MRYGNLEHFPVTVTGSIRAEGDEFTMNLNYYSLDFFEPKSRESFFQTNSYQAQAMYACTTKPEAVFGDFSKMECPLRTDLYSSDCGTVAVSFTFEHWWCGWRRTIGVGFVGAPAPWNATLSEAVLAER
jgi:hypothetical protein